MAVASSRAVPARAAAPPAIIAYSGPTVTHRPETRSGETVKVVSSSTESKAWNALASRSLSATADQMVRSTVVLGGASALASASNATGSAEHAPLRRHQRQHRTRAEAVDEAAALRRGYRRGYQAPASVAPAARKGALPARFVPQDILVLRALDSAGCARGSRQR